jgi:hypothetical protein
VPSVRGRAGCAGGQDEVAEPSTSACQPGSTNVWRGIDDEAQGRE